MSKELYAVENQIREPSSPVGQYELPCGWIEQKKGGEKTLHREVILNAISGEEEDILASEDVANEQKMNLILGQCLKKIGTVDDVKRIKQEVVPQLLIGDQVFLFFALRRLSVGNLFPFQAECPHCKERKSYLYDTSNIPIIDMEEPEKRSYEAVLPFSQKTVKFRCPTVRDSEELRELEKQYGDKLTAQLMIRVTHLDGDPPTRLDLKRLSMGDRDFMRGKFIEVDGGVETEIELECENPQCRRKFDHSLDPAAEGFFSPSASQARSKRRSRSSSKRTRTLGRTKRS